MKKKDRYFIIKSFMLISILVGLKLYYFSDSNSKIGILNNDSVATLKTITTDNYITPTLETSQSNKQSVFEAKLNIKKQLSVDSRDIFTYHIDSNNIHNMIQILNDPFTDKTCRKDIAKALIMSKTQEGIISVLKALGDAYSKEDYDLKESLMQIFEDQDSVKIVDILTDVITEKSIYSYESSESLDDVAYGKKIALVTIRSIPNDDIADMLVQKYYYADSEEEKQKLLAISHPVMLAQIASDAFEQEDSETADRLMEELTDIEDCLVIKGMMLLARKKTIPLDDIAYNFSFWNFSDANNQTHIILDDYLNNPLSFPEERALAAYALVYESDQELAISSLKQAQLFEKDDLVNEYIEESLSQIDNS